MKNIFYLLVSFILIASCSSGPKDVSELDAAIIETDNDGTKEPKMKFKDDITAWDFGKITEGERVEHTFKFTNVGSSDLVISSATASCGCTIPSPPKEPIAPGESSEIKVEFNSAGKSDMVIKDVTILANSNPVKTMLQIKAFVEKKELNE